MRRHALLLLCAWLGCAMTTRAADARPPRPNIIFLLADDLGWADVGYHGGKIKTPHLDKLAAAGAKLEFHYVQPLCSPTRAALMSGRYPLRHGLQVGVVKPSMDYGLPLDERTLPQALKEAGYFTAITGKWHLGHVKPDYLPTRRGFDHQYGHFNGAIDYFTHERDGGLDWHRHDKGLREEGYTTHLLAREAVGIIEKHDTSRPLFLYVPFNAPHAPYQVPEEYTKPYASEKPTRRNFCGMVVALDEAVGKIVAAVEKRGLRGNTLFIFSSDNGGVAPGTAADNGPLRAGKGTVYEGGTRVPAFATWDGRIKPGAVVNAPMHMVDWYPTLLTLAGVSLKQKHPLDGFNMWPVIAEGKASPRKEVVHNIAPDLGALRIGDWKLVVNGHRRDSGDVDGRKKGKQSAEPSGDQVELFNLASDPYEKSNLAAQNPAKVKELRARYDELARQAAKPLIHPTPEGFKAPRVWGETD
ncbi:MAG: arylsulfatase [Verrucomicrobiota bacterium]